MAKPKLEYNSGEKYYTCPRCRGAGIVISVSTREEVLCSVCRGSTLVKDWSHIGEIDG